MAAEAIQLTQDCAACSAHGISPDAVSFVLNLISSYQFSVSLAPKS